MEPIEEIKSTLKELNSAVADMHKLDERVAEVESKGEKVPELLKEQAGKLDARLDELEAKYERQMRAPSIDEGKSEEAKQAAALGAFLRKGVVGENGAERKSVEVKSLSAGTATDGQELVNPGYLREIQQGIVEFSPMRGRVRVLTISGPSIDIPKRTSTGSATWVSETGARADTGDPQFGTINVPPFELYARIEVSQQLLEDAEFDIAAYVREDMAEQFGVAEGAAMVNGDGAGKPVGIIDSSAGVDTVDAGDQTTWILAADDLFDLFYNVKGGYAARGEWLVNRLTLPVIRKLKDGNGNYLWAPALAPGNPNLILGKPYVEATDLPAPTAGAFASGDRPILFGDFRRAYTLVDRVGVQITRDPYTAADNGLVVFRARKRVGGKPNLTEAAKALQF